MAFFQDHPRSRQPFLNAPATVLWLIAAMLAAHVLRVMLPGSGPDDVIRDYALIPARYAEALSQGLPPEGVLGLVIPFVTYMFLHGDFTHVGINSLWLLVFGPIVVRRLGTKRFLMFFLFCGVIAALVHVLVYWGSTAAVVGASGAVSGLMGGGMRVVYGRLSPDPNGLAPVLSRPIIGFSLVWVAVNIVTGLLRVGISDDLTLVAWVAHLGGYFAGLLTIGAFDRPQLEKEGLRSA